MIIDYHFYHPIIANVANPDLHLLTFVGSVTHYYLPMDSVYGEMLINPSGLDSSAIGRPKFTRGIINKALVMDTRHQYIKVTGPGHRYECLGDLDLCPLGMLVFIFLIDGRTKSATALTPLLIVI